MTRLLLIALLSLAALGLFVRPVGDDVCEYADARTYGVGLMTHMYETWSGRYSLFALKGGLYATLGESVPTLMPAVLLAALVSVWTWALRRIVPNPPLIVLAVIIAALLGMPNLFQGVYWSSASLMYLAPIAASGVLVGALIRGWHPLIVAVIAFVTAGFNEPHTLLQGGLLLMALWRWRRASLLAALVATGIGFAVSMAAPGNALRAGYLPPPAPLLESMVAAFRVTSDRILATLVHTPIALAVPFAVGWFIAPTRPLRRRLILCLSVVLFAVALAVGTVFPVQYAMTVPEPRAYTLAQFVIGIAALALGYVTGSGQPLPSPVLRLVGALALCAVLSWVVTNGLDMFTYSFRVDRGQRNDYLATQIGSANEGTDWVQDCRQRLTVATAD